MKNGSKRWEPKNLTSLRWWLQATPNPFERYARLSNVYHLPQIGVKIKKKVYIYIYLNLDVGVVP